MRRIALPSAVLGVVALSFGCHTITEELPSRPAPVNVGGIPVVIVPVGANPAPAPTATPAPNTPAPAPTPRPDPTPAPGGGGGGGPAGNNTAPVTRVGASVYFIERNGQVLPDTNRATQALVGDRVHLDCTPKDASNAPTNPRGTPTWSFSNPGSINLRAHPYNPTIIGQGPHTQCMSAAVDGIRSEEFCITFK